MKRPSFILDPKGKSKAQLKADARQAYLAHIEGGSRPPGHDVHFGWAAS